MNTIERNFRGHYLDEYDEINGHLAARGAYSLMRIPCQNIIVHQFSTLDKPSHLPTSRFI